MIHAAIWSTTLIATVALSFAPVHGEEEAIRYPPDDVAEILVLGPEGQPVGGAKVELLAEPAVPSEVESSPVAVTGTTGEDGRVRISVIPSSRS